MQAKQVLLQSWMPRKYIVEPNRYYVIQKSKHNSLQTQTAEIGHIE